MLTNVTLSNNIENLTFTRVEEKLTSSAAQINFSIKGKGVFKSITYDTQTEQRLFRTLAKASEKVIYNVNIALKQSDSTYRAFRLHFNKTYQSLSSNDEKVAYILSRILSIKGNHKLIYKPDALLVKTDAGVIYPCNFFII